MAANRGAGMVPRCLSPGPLALVAAILLVPLLRSSDGEVAAALQAAALRGIGLFAGLSLLTSPRGAAQAGAGRRTIVVLLVAVLAQATLAYATSPLRSLLAAEWLGLAATVLLAFVALATPPAWLARAALLAALAVAVSAFASSPSTTEVNRQVRPRGTLPDAETLGVALAPAAAAALVLGLRTRRIALLATAAAALAGTVASLSRGALLALAAGTFAGLAAGTGTGATEEVAVPRGGARRVLVASLAVALAGVRARSRLAGGDRTERARDRAGEPVRRAQRFGHALAPRAHPPRLANGPRAAMVRLRPGELPVARAGGDARRPRRGLAARAIGAVAPRPERFHRDAGHAGPARAGPYRGDRGAIDARSLAPAEDRVRCRQPGGDGRPRGVRAPASPARVDGRAAGRRGGVRSRLAAGGPARCGTEVPWYMACAEAALVVAASMAAAVLPADAGLAIRRARAFEAEGRSGDALAEWQRYQRLAPAAPRPAFRRARAQGLHGDLAGGERTLRALLDRWPHHQPARLLLGELLLSTSRPDEALTWLGEVDAPDLAPAARLLEIRARRTRLGEFRR